MHAIAAVVLAIVIVVPAAAQNKCAANKIKATGKEAYCLLKPEAKQANNGSPVDPIKVQKCRYKFSNAFVKAEATLPCLTVGDEATIEDKVDAFVADVDARLSPPPSTISECQAQKIRASQRKAKCLLDVTWKAVEKGAPPDPLRVLTCETKHMDAFAEADGRDDCTTTGDGGDLEDVVDAFVDDVVGELGGSPSGAFVEPAP